MKKVIDLELTEEDVKNTQAALENTTALGFSPVQCCPVAQAVKRATNAEGVRVSPYDVTTFDGRGGIVTYSLDQRGIEKVKAFDNSRYLKPGSDWKSQVPLGPFSISTVHVGHE